jgi:uncharacterized membrane protein
MKISAKRIFFIITGSFILLLGILSAVTGILVIIVEFIKGDTSNYIETTFELIWNLVVPTIGLIMLCIGIAAEDN